VKLTSTVKTLISGATSSYTTFTLIVARRYQQKFAAVVTITDQAYKKCIKTLRNFLLNLKGQGPLILKINVQWHNGKS
jgi:ethanolamine utilization protein EutP (predicted NTPase)